MHFSRHPTQLAVLLAVLLTAQTAFATPLIDTLLPPGSEGAAGFFIGSLDFGPPSGVDTLEIAQKFTSDAEYSDVTAAASLSTDAGLTTIGNAPLTLTFALAFDDSGSPGAALATAEVTLTSPGLNSYDINFEDLSLEDGTYWLVASSALLEYGTGSPLYGSGPTNGTLPNWALVDGVVAGVPPGNFGFALYGTPTGNSTGQPIVPEGGWYSQDSQPWQSDFPPVPEPSTLLLLATGLLVVFWMGWRRAASAHFGSRAWIDASRP